jgi:hypothetical protein
MDGCFVRGLRGDGENCQVRGETLGDELVQPAFFTDCDGSTFLC